MKLLVTGGAGFIGSALIRKLLEDPNAEVINVDKLTYAGSLTTLPDQTDNAKHHFEKVDICDRKELDRVFETYRPEGVIHLAAESHVDRSIDGPGEFIRTNVDGTFELLRSSQQYLQGLSAAEQRRFRFLHVSTDEVFGSLGLRGYFTETTPYQPRSPYSASKAASDHLIQAWVHTYGFPAVTTNCSNNFGPFQFPEKLIPLTILKALCGEKIPVYGNGSNIRDWLFVEDHVQALLLVFAQGKIGQTYNIGGNSERKNIEVVETLCALLDEFQPNSPILASGKKHSDLIQFVEDRPGHDLRYAMDITKIRTELGWQPKHSFESALRKTVNWYLENREWWQAILTRKYQGERLGRKQPSRGASL